MRFAGVVLLAVLAASALAGCTSSDGGFFAATDAQADAPPAAQAPGVTLHVRVSGGGDTLRIHAEARNGGEETYRVPSACAGSGAEASAESATQPFSLSARRTTSETAGDFPVYPQQGCSRVVATPFGPGARRTFDLDWNGTVWLNGFGHPGWLWPGDHLLDVALEVYVGDAAAPSPLVATLPFTVRGADDSRNAYLAPP